LRHATPPPADAVQKLTSLPKWAVPSLSSRNHGSTNSSAVLDARRDVSSPVTGRVCKKVQMDRSNTPASAGFLSCAAQETTNQATSAHEHTSGWASHWLLLQSGTVTSSKITDANIVAVCERPAHLPVCIDRNAKRQRFPNCHFEQLLSHSNTVASLRALISQHIVQWMRTPIVPLPRNQPLHLGRTPASDRVATLLTRPHSKIDTSTHQEQCHRDRESARRRTQQNESLVKLIPLGNISSTRMEYRRSRGQQTPLTPLEQSITTSHSPVEHKGLPVSLKTCPTIAN
jgi:hypothetical protein